MPGRHHNLCAVACVLLVAASATFCAAAGPRQPPIAVEKLDRKTPVDFEKELLPVLNASCVSCHNRTKPKAGLVLETPADIRKGGENGPAAIAGKPADSLLIRSASHNDANIEPMPPAGNKVNARSLTTRQLGLLRLWIEQGATGDVKGPAPLKWQAVDGAVQPIYAAAITPDGQIAAAGRGTSIDLYDLKTAKWMARLTDPSIKAGPAAHHDVVQSLSFSPDGRTLASGAFREIKLWIRSDSDSASAWTLARTIGSGGNDSPLLDRVNALDFSPDGKLLAAGGGVPSRSGQIAICSVADGRIEKSFDDVHSDSVLALQFSADGKQIVSGSADKFVRLTDLASGKVLHSFEGHAHHVLGVAISKDGKVIVSAGADNLIRFWEVESGEKKKNSPTFDKEVTCVRFAGPDTVVACTGDAKVKVYKSSSGAELKSLQGATDYMFCCSASGDGKTVIAGGQDGVLRVWSADGKTPILLQPGK